MSPIYDLYINGQYVDSCRASSAADAADQLSDTWDLSGDNYEIEEQERDYDDD